MVIGKTDRGSTIFGIDGVQARTVEQLLVFVNFTEFYQIYNPIDLRLKTHKTII